MDPLALRLDDLERRVKELETAVAWIARPAAVDAAPAIPRETPPTAAHGGAAHVEAASAVAPRPPRADDAPPRPLPAPHRRRAPARAAPRAPGDLERWLGGVLLARVGIGAVVLAAAYFAQLAYRNVPDAFKVLSLYGLSAALLGTGHLLRARAATRYVGVLQGGAVAVAYVAGLAASLRYHLVAPEVGLVLLAGAAALGTWLARRLQVEALAAVSALGALAAPALLGLVHETHWLVLALLLGVNAWSGWARLRWGWSATRAVVLLGATLLAAEWFFAARLWDETARLAGMHGTLLLLLLPELAGLARRQDVPKALSVIAGCALGLLLATHVGVEGAGFRNSGPIEGTALLASGGWLGLLYALGAAGREKDGAFFVRTLARLAGIATVLGAWVVWEHARDVVRLVPALAALAPLLLLLRRRLEVGDGAALVAALVAWAATNHASAGFVHDAAHALAPATALGLLALALVPAGALAVWGRTPPARAAGGMLGGALLLSAFGTLGPLAPAWWLATWGACAAWFVLVAVAGRLRQDRALAGTAALGLLLVALGWGLVSLTMGRAAGWGPALDPHTLTALVVAAAAFGARRVLGIGDLLDPDARGALVGAALALLALAGGREVHLLTRGMEGAWSPVLMSVYVTLVAAGMLVGGFVRQARALRLVALALFAGVVLKVGLYDLATARLELRVLVTLVLGLTLLASAFAYARVARRGEGGGEGNGGEGTRGEEGSP